MSTNVDLAFTKTGVIDSSTPTTHITPGATFTGTSNQRLLLGIPLLSAVPAAYLYKKITGEYLRMYFTTAGTAPQKYAWHDGDFNAGTVTYNDIGWDPTFSSYDYINPSAGWADMDIAGVTPAYSVRPKSAAQRMFLDLGYYPNASTVYTTLGSNPPVLRYVVDESTTVTGSLTNLAPQTGYIDENEANTFSWGIAKTGDCLGNITIAGATFRWRTDASGTVHTVSCGAVNSYTAPASTFSTDAVQWSVVVTLNTGDTLTSDWFTLSTVEASSTAVAVSPKDSLVDRTEALTFSWQHIISTGTAQTAADLQQSTDGSTWSTLATVSGADTEVTVPANTLSTGTVYWRVRTYNTDDVAGSWSDAVSVTCVGAPDAPVVSVSRAAPRPVIAWQSSGQQGYRVRIGDVYDSGERYGVAQSFTLPDILPDGSYTVSVTVCGVYGLWSEAGTVGLTVSNSAGSAVTLAVQALGTYALLRWTSADTGLTAAVYRDGELIAVTDAASFTDNEAAGSCAYFVRLLRTGANAGHYTQSNTVTVSVLPDCLSICDAETGIWQTLQISDAQYRTEAVSTSRAVSYVNVSGSAYPVPVLSEFYERSMTFSCAFKDTAAELAFSLLAGRKVIVKNRRGQCVTGILESVSLSSGLFYAAYSCTVRQTAPDEEVALP